MLDCIGYDISLSLLKKKYYEQLIFVYSSRYKSNKKDITSTVELHFINIMLTKQIK